MTLHHLMLFLHLIGVVMWVGGMAFAYLCLRPAAMALAPAQRLGLWARVLAIFFPMVWSAIFLLFFSGTAMLFEVGFARAPVSWHLMLVTGLIMTGVYASLWFGPWRVLRLAVHAEEWARAAVALNVIRQRVGFNLALGTVTIAIATMGLAW